MEIHRSTKVEKMGANRSENAVRSRWHMYLRPDAPFASTPRPSTHGSIAAGSAAMRKAAAKT